MTNQLLLYNEKVSIYSLSSKLIGTATFSGKRWRKRKYGNWNWRGILIKTDFDATTIAGQRLTLELADGTNGKVRCSALPANKPGVVEVIGVGNPPGVT